MDKFYRQQQPNNGCRRKYTRSDSGMCRRKRTRKFDREASNNIVKEFGHIVKFIAHKLAYNLPPSVDLDDLISVGLIGLLEAAERFDAKRGYKFTTFAEFRIRGAMIDELRRQDWMPRGARERSKRYEQTCQEMVKENGRKPSNKEIGKRLGISEKKAAELEKNRGGLVLFDDIEHLSKEDKAMVEASNIELDFSPYEFTSRNNIQQLMKKVIHDLSDRHQNILVMYYFEELSLKEIGARLSISESRVSQLHMRALQELKKILDDKAEYAELKRLLA